MSVKRIIGTSIKLLIIVLLVWILIIQFRRSDNQDLWTAFTLNFNPGSIGYLLVAFGLMFINWGLEAMKWKSIVQNFKGIELMDAWRGVLMGVCFSLLTPLRLGDYMGRIITLPGRQSGKGIVANFLISLAQNIVHIGIGIFAFLVYLNLYGGLNLIPNSIILFISSFTILALLYVYFSPSFLRTIFLKNFWPDWIKRFSNYFEFIQDVSSHKLAMLLSFSLIRYFVFIIQYYCLIQYFGLEISAFEIGIGIATIYLIQSVIPLPALIGFVARAEIAIIIWGVFTNNIIGILAASYGLWIINQIIPAIIGLYYFIRTDINMPLGSFVKNLNRSILGQNDPNPEP